MNERKQRIEALFEEALALAAPELRASHLARACGDDADLRREVEELLRAAEQAGGFLAVKPGETAASSDLPQPSAQGESASVEQPGAIIGRYKLLERIGEGGCGVVYMAEQEEPVRRKVALKIIKPGMDSRQVIARFEAERQALAMMDHPNIAKVFDGGVTGTEGRAGILPAPAAPAANVVRAGENDAAPAALSRQDACPTLPRPYFVMELVRGIRITDYCEQHNLSTCERLDLFIQVCSAIQHAHQKGVIHRDIKPSNVLVTENDGVPVPKVIDFGIAKATEHKLTDKTLFTQFAAFIGTPAYMSPEQAALTSLDIDTRSDIYSLGVLLYELLTGTTPFDTKELLKAGFDEMRRVIRETEPEKPSTRLMTRKQVRKWESGKVRETSAATNLESPLPTFPPAHLPAATTPTLNSQLKPLSTDLDWIVMKCLEKDRARRYETAIGLAADLQRHLSNEPVVARPPSAAYRFQKLVRRNKLPFIAGAAVLLVASLGVSGIVIQLFRAERAGKQARHNLDTAFRAIRELSAVALDERLQDPGIDDLQQRLFGTIMPFLEEFVKQRPDDPALEAEQAQASYSLALLLQTTGRFKEAESQFVRVIALYTNSITIRPANSQYRRNLAATYADYAWLLSESVHHIEAVAAGQTALAILERLAKDIPDTTAYREDFGRAYHSYGTVLVRHGSRAAEAERALREAVRIRRELAASPDARPVLRNDLGIALLNLGNHVSNQQRPPETEELWTNAVSVFAALAADVPGVPEYQQRLAVTHDRLARLYADTARWAQADESFKKATSVLENLVANYPRRPAYQGFLADACYQMGVRFSSAGRTNQATEVLEKAVALNTMLTTNYPANLRYRQSLITTCDALGKHFERIGQSTSAESAYRRAIRVADQLTRDPSTNNK